MAAQGQVNALVISPNGRMQFSDQVAGLPADKTARDIKFSVVSFLFATSIVVIAGNPFGQWDSMVIGTLAICPLAPRLHPLLKNHFVRWNAMPKEAKYSSVAVNFVIGTLLPTLSYLKDPTFLPSLSNWKFENTVSVGAYVTVLFLGMLALNATHIHFAENSFESRLKRDIDQFKSDRDLLKEVYDGSLRLLKDDVKLAPLFAPLDSRFTSDLQFTLPTFVLRENQIGKYSVEEQSDLQKEITRLKIAFRELFKTLSSDPILLAEC